MLSHSISFGNDGSEFQFIDDLNTLCKRHRVHCGGRQDLEHLPSDLASNDNFRIDLFTLCTAISHMAKTDLSPQQLWVLVARALGGPEASIGEAADLLPDATSAFIEGYERWTHSGPGPDAHPIDNDLEMASSEPKPGRYYTAPPLSSSYLLGMQDDPATLPANGTPGGRSIPANTPLESLTLNELRMYLEDIENRVRRIGPHLERIALEAVPPAPPERAEALAPQPAPEAKAVAVPLTEPVIETIVPVGSTGLTTEAPPSSPATSLHAKAVPVPALPAKAPNPTREASHLHRLRVVNAVLACLLLLVCTATAIFVYRYLYSRPETLAGVLHKPPSPAVDLPSETNPQALTSAAQKPDVVSSTPSSAPAAVQPSDNPGPDKPAAAPLSASPTTSGGTLPPHKDTRTQEHDVTKARGHEITKTQAREVMRTQGHEATTTPLQVETAKLSPPAPKSLETSTSPRPNQPTPAPPATDNQNHPLPKAAPAAAATDPAKSAPEHPAVTPVTLSMVAAKSSPSLPAGTPTRAPLPHPAPPANSPVVVPPSTMLAYGIAMPKPIYPSLRHSPTASTVEVAVNISKEGKVTSAHVVSGSFDVSSAALDAVRYWRFKPFVLDGNPVEVVTTLKFVFGPH